MSRPVPAPKKAEALAGVRTQELACEHVLQKATPGQATLYKRTALQQGRPKGIGKPIVEEAIRQLTARRELIPVTVGKSAYVLHARSVAPLLPPAAPATAPVRDAYAALVREGGFADVRIDQLAARSGGALADVKAWLLGESRAGRAAPTRGDWSLADASARAAAIEIRGEPHLQIRLL